MGTAIVCLLLVLAAVCIIRAEIKKWVRAKKTGTCACGCSGCASSGCCAGGCSGTKQAEK